MSSSPETTGSQLLHALFAGFNAGVDEVVSLFAEQARIEFPYADSVGTPARLTLAEYRKYLAQVLPQMPHLRYGEVRVYPLQAPGGYWAEVHAATTVPGTSQPYAQDYVIYFTVADGRFTHYREYWNPVPWLRAFGGEQALAEIVKPTT